MRVPIARSVFLLFKDNHFEWDEVFAGLAVAIPVVGPYLGTMPAILIALALSPHLALILAGWR